MKRRIQQELLQKYNASYGGELMKRRKGRLHGRPLAVKSTMHLVLRSTKAKNDWSFKRHHNEREILKIVSKFSKKYGVRVLSLANVGNHLHFHIKLSNRFGYTPFIRAISASIAMAVTGRSRLNPLKGLKFWDYRPFTRIVQSFRAYLNLRDYIKINEMEGFGVVRPVARFLVKRDRWLSTA